MIALLDSRITLALVGFIGMAMCSAGIGRVAASGRWADPLSIVGYILGLAALGYCQLNNPWNLWYCPDLPNRSTMLPEIRPALCQPGASTPCADRLQMASR